MCALFGWLDIKGIIPHKLLLKLTQELANAAEERGTDASGISYIKNGKVTIYKRPKPAHKLKFNFPENTKAVMGHTRLTTQGNQKYNWNNHPFLGKADKEFAFAHNGVLFNDSNLRKEKKLPPTCIETDSYVAVQLIERQGTLDFDSLKSMAEDVQGNFTFTLLDEENTLYFVKGSSPMYLLYFEMFGLYVYASTESIMKKALRAVGLHKYKFEEIPVHEEDILSIDVNGNIAHDKYESYRYSFLSDYYNPYDNYYTCHEELLLEMCNMFGVDEEDVLLLLDYGYRADEIEDMMMDTVLLHEALKNIKYEDSGYYSEYCRGVV